MPETIGLDIGSHSIKLVGLRTTAKGAFLTHLGIKKIPAGGNKEDAAYISQILKILVSEAGLKTKKVSLTVSGSGVNIQRISIPFMPRAELKVAVRWEIKEHLPFPVETAQIDFHILGEMIEENVKKLDLMVVACPNHLIEQTLSTVRGAGLQPIHLTVGPFALWNAFEALGQVKEAEEVALIDLGADKTGIHFFKGENLQFYREVTPAGADITRAIMDGLGSGEEPKVLYEKAENIKEMLGISSEGSEEILRQAQDESINVSKIIFYMRPILERMVAEIGRSLDYYKNQFNVDRIDRVLLTGGGAHLKNFSAYLQRELRLPVEHFNPLKEILFDSKKIDAETLDQMGSRFMVAAGLALPQPKRIELLPGLEPVITKARILKAIPILSPLIALLVFLVIIWSMSAQVASVKRERDAKVGKVANFETLQTKLTSLKEEEQRLKEELSGFPSSLMISVPHGQILKEITHIVPDNVTLKLLSVQAKGKSLKREVQASKPQEGESQQDQETELHITGIAFGSDIQFLTALAHIIGGLDKSPLFKNAKLMSADENKLYNRPGAEFKIVCDIVSENLNPHPPLD